MSRTSDRRIVEVLRRDAAAARREPSRAFRENLRAAIAPGARGPDRPPLVALGGSAGMRERLRSASVAASILLAAGLWVFAFVDGLGGEGDVRAPAGRTVREANANSTTADVLARLSRVRPETLGSEVEGSLLAELERISEDATRAARYLAGRLPRPLVASGPGASPH